jgi:hypothetical protein
MIGLVLSLLLTAKDSSVAAMPCGQDADALLRQYRQILEDRANQDPRPVRLAATRAHFHRCYLRQAKLVQQKSEPLQLSKYLWIQLYETDELAAYQAAKQISWPLTADSIELAERLQQIAIVARDTAWALQLQQQYQLKNDILPPLPEALKQSPGRPVFQEQNGQRHWQSFTFKAGPQIVLVTRSGCYFTQQFEQYLQQKPALAKLFQQHGTRIASIGLQAETDPAIAEIYRAEDWPEIDNWGTPTFYFYHDGQLQGSVIGWPKAGREDELLTMLRRIRLLD